MSRTWVSCPATAIRDREEAGFIEIEGRSRRASYRLHKDRMLRTLPGFRLEDLLRGPILVWTRAAPVCQ